MLVGHLYIFYGEVSIRFVFPFFHWVADIFAVGLCKWFVILGIKPLSVHRLQIFSPSIPLYICTNILNPFINGHLGCFHFLPIVNSAAMNTRMHEYFSMKTFSGYVPRDGIAESYGTSMYSFLR